MHRHYVIWIKLYMQICTLPASVINGCLCHLTSRTDSVCVGGVCVQVTASFTSLEQKQYAGAGAVAEEVLSSIRTVFAFSGEEKEIERYKHKLRSATRLGARKGLLSGILIGLLTFIMLAMYSLALW